ncbi:cobyrinic acid A,C-diamide synthase CobB (plasmid) [Peptoclostridium acidaminophilum DSM 3953]|uniref:Cobyrinate a,c-diamide synthase n=1 Tax=Peptoclostridium acidaminophilum DSM 3953 TaxID=1286171 RepID=W8TIE9_PEPAC|nr:cobyrinate a,c-diamide synthase [Peptoclostridium acidaminophilum]AHM57603.1 cobyrinic acid A,C-diamide synthase CobB [Peptoclostridium acidaminophilum DSM 3953]
MKRVVIAGASSGVGKTTITAAIMAALTRRGRRVAPFKVGPDYIDPQFHRRACGRASSNLDCHMLGEAETVFLLQRGLKGHDIGIIEGVMGLFDGGGEDGQSGSTAELARITKTPIVLIIDGRGVSTSAAATVLGFVKFRNDIEIKGVIVNGVSGRKHYELIKEAVEEHVGVSCIGYMCQSEGVSLKSRHLGLVQADEVESLGSLIESLADMAEETIDLARLESIAEEAAELPQEKDPFEASKGMLEGLSIAYACDEAFSFYYNDNLLLLQELGANLVPFSPIRDERLPEGAEALYIGGGYPEVFAKSLEENALMRSHIRERLEGGMPAYAECGGLMYLTAGICGLGGEWSDMAGFFPGRAIMSGKLQRFGYVKVCAREEVCTIGHEFHRSYVEGMEGVETLYSIKRTSGGDKTWSCGYVRNNVLAGYPHIHFYSSPEFTMQIMNLLKGEGRAW